MQLEHMIAIYPGYIDKKEYNGEDWKIAVTFCLGKILDLQWCALENQQSPFYDMKWGHFDRENSTFKMLLSSWNFHTVLKKIRSFDAENLGSVD